MSKKEKMPVTIAEPVAIINIRPEKPTIKGTCEEPLETIIIFGKSEMKGNHGKIGKEKDEQPEGGGHELQGRKNTKQASRKDRTRTGARTKKAGYANGRERVKARIRERTKATHKGKEKNKIRRGRRTQKREERKKEREQE